MFMNMLGWWFHGWNYDNAWNLVVKDSKVSKEHNWVKWTIGVNWVVGINLKF